MSKIQKGPELFAAIRRLHAEGKTARQAATIIGVTVGTVNYNRRLLELPPFLDIRTATRARVRELHAEGKTANEVAQLLGMSVNAVNQHRVRLNLPRFKTAPRKAQLRAAIRLLHWEGKTAKQAAAILGVCIDTINRQRRLLDLAPFTKPFSGHARHNAWTDAEDALLECCIADGVRKAEAARRIGRSMRAIQWRRRRLGLPGFKHVPPVPPRKWVPERVEKLADLVAKRISYRLIAKELGTTKGSVGGAVRDYLKETA
jgi:hypothetical protein